MKRRATQVLSDSILIQIVCVTNFPTPLISKCSSYSGRTSKEAAIPPRTNIRLLSSRVEPFSSRQASQAVRLSVCLSTYSWSAIVRSHEVNKSDSWLLRKEIRLFFHWWTKKKLYGCFFRIIINTAYFANVMLACLPRPSRFALILVKLTHIDSPGCLMHDRGRRERKKDAARGIRYLNDEVIWIK